jgi:hypothetical protein
VKFLLFLFWAGNAENVLHSKETALHEYAGARAQLCGL